MQTFQRLVNLVHDRGSMYGGKGVYNSLPPRTQARTRPCPEANKAVRAETLRQFPHLFARIIVLDSNHSPDLIIAPHSSRPRWLRDKAYWEYLGIVDEVYLPMKS